MVDDLVAELRMRVEIVDTRVFIMSKQVLLKMKASEKKRSNRRGVRHVSFVNGFVQCAKCGKPIFLKQKYKRTKTNFYHYPECFRRI